jgi:hypothetical protein
MQLYLNNEIVPSFDPKLSLVEKAGKSGKDIELIFVPVKNK